MYTVLPASKQHILIETAACMVVEVLENLVNWFWLVRGVSHSLRRQSYALYIVRVPGAGEIRAFVRQYFVDTLLSDSAEWLWPKCAFL